MQHFGRKMKNWPRKHEQKRIMKINTLFDSDKVIINSVEKILKSH
jgi:hypothetical protein